MTRVFILMGFAFMFMHLHATGHISKYINMKYSYISLFAMFVLFFLTLYQWYLQSKDDRNHEGNHCDCHNPHDHHHHDHEHGDKKWYSRLWTSVLMVFPVFSVLFIPIATLNSTMIEAKGFNFPILQDKDPSSIHQFLAPDTSYYYGSEDYTGIMNRLMKRYSEKESLIINDKNYLELMELIYNSPGNFMSKNIQFEGFTYNSHDLRDNQIFLFRFGIIHCLADSGVYGMLVDLPENSKMRNDEWVQVKGTLSSVYYQPFKRNIPILQVHSWKHIQKPGEEYVYKQY